MRGIKFIIIMHYLIKIVVKITCKYKHNKLKVFKILRAELLFSGTSQSKTQQYL